MPERLNRYYVDPLTGVAPIETPSSKKIHTNIDTGLCSCYGVELEGPNRKAVLPLSIGSKQFAEKELAQWENVSENLKARVIYIEENQLYERSEQWGRLPAEVIWTVHGTRNRGNIRADGIKCVKE